MQGQVSFRTLVDLLGKREAYFWFLRFVYICLGSHQSDGCLGVYRYLTLATAVKLNYKLHVCRLACQTNVELSWFHWCSETTVFLFRTDLFGGGYALAWLFRCLRFGLCAFFVRRFLLPCCLRMESPGILADLFHYITGLWMCSFLLCCRSRGFFNVLIAVSFCLGQELRPQERDHCFDFITLWLTPAFWMNTADGDLLMEISAGAFSESLPSSGVGRDESGCSYFHPAHYFCLCLLSMDLLLCWRSRMIYLSGVWLFHIV